MKILHSWNKNRTLEKETIKNKKGLLERTIQGLKWKFQNWNVKLSKSPWINASGESPKKVGAYTVFDASEKKAKFL